jgi:hypothetical protein
MESKKKKKKGETKKKKENKKEKKKKEEKTTRCNTYNHVPNSGIRTNPIVQMHSCTHTVDTTNNTKYKQKDDLSPPGPMKICQPRPVSYGCSYLLCEIRTLPPSFAFRGGNRNRRSKGLRR